MYHPGVTVPIQVAILSIATARIAEVTLKQFWYSMHQNYCNTQSLAILSITTGKNCNSLNTCSIKIVLIFHVSNCCNTQNIAMTKNCSSFSTWSTKIILVLHVSKLLQYTKYCNSLDTRSIETVALLSIAATKNCSSFDT